MSQQWAGADSATPNSPGTLPSSDMTTSCTHDHISKQDAELSIWCSSSLSHCVCPTVFKIKIKLRLSDCNFSRCIRLGCNSIKERDDEALDNLTSNNPKELKIKSRWEEIKEVWWAPVQHQVWIIIIQLLKSYTSSGTRGRKRVWGGERKSGDSGNRKLMYYFCIYLTMISFIDYFTVNTWNFFVTWLNCISQRYFSCETVGWQTTSLVIVSWCVCVCVESTTHMSPNSKQSYPVAQVLRAASATHLIVISARQFTKRTDKTTSLIC